MRERDGEATAAITPQALARNDDAGGPDTLDDLRKTEAERRRMIDNLPVLSWRGSPDGSKDFFNLRWHHYTGLSAAEAHGSGWHVTVHPDDMPQVRKLFLELVASGKPVEVEARLRRFDGEYRWLLCRAEPVRDELGNIVRLYGTHTEIEERKEAEDKPRAREHELRRLITPNPQASV